MRSFQRSLVMLFGALTLCHISAPAKADNQQATTEPKPTFEITYRVYPKCTHSFQRTTYNVCGVDVATIGKIEKQLISVLPGRIITRSPIASDGEADNRLNSHVVQGLLLGVCQQTWVTKKIMDDVMKPYLCTTK